ncbi:hypothetical protein PaecuDRAFT_4053 [Paenibacillus curdlanolyticus YK9]|uniref:Uncharacterized protein n=1 Tax=Paenibacillus curdlanolyticus YK9 TaxID=717606 RepID=E0IEG2_9BACL|nr:hypothetical protein PaecuDRAFT_4053 [Paenibacillus curdlanolyticus YK9]
MDVQEKAVGSDAGGFFRLSRAWRAGTGDEKRAQRAYEMHAMLYG